MAKLTANKNEQLQVNFFPKRESHSRNVSGGSQTINPCNQSNNQSAVFEPFPSKTEAKSLPYQDQQRGFILLNEPQKREINLVDDIQKSEFTLEKPPRDNSRNQRLISVTSDNEAL